MTNSTTFTDRRTPIMAAWLNDVNGHVFEDAVAVRRLASGIDPTGVSDSTVGLNAAFAYAAQNGIAVLLGNGRFKISDTLWATPQGSDFLSCRIIGAGNGYSESDAQTVIDATGLTDKPAINIQKARGAYVGRICIDGAGKSISGLGVAALTYGADYVDVTRDSQFSPYCGIAIDAGLGSTPSDGGYPGFTYQGESGGSSCVTLDQLTIRNFVVGIMHNPENGAQQGDTVDIYAPQIYDTKVAIATGNSQSRCVTVYGGNIGWCRTAFDAREYGGKSGSSPTFYNTQFGPCFELISVHNGISHTVLSGCRSESVHRLGEAGGGGVGVLPVNLLGTSIQLINSSTGKCCPVLWEGGILNWLGGNLLRNGTNADAFFINATTTTLQSVLIGILNRFKPFIGCGMDFNTPTDIRQCRVYDTTAAVNYGDERRAVSLSGRQTKHWSSLFQRVGSSLYRYVPARTQNYINTSTCSNWSFSASSMTFDCTNSGDILVGDVLYWKFNAIGKNASQTTGPGIKVTSVSAPTVTCDLLYDRSYYDETYAPSTMSILFNEWAPGEALTGDTTNGSKTVSNVSPTTILQNGDWVLSTDGGIATPNRVASGGGTATITLTRNATATQVGATLFNGRLHTLSSTAAF